MPRIYRPIPSVVEEELEEFSEEDWTPYEDAPVFIWKPYTRNFKSNKKFKEIYDEFKKVKGKERLKLRKELIKLRGR